jgi:hypothetical protein
MDPAIIASFVACVEHTLADVVLCQFSINCRITVPPILNLNCNLFDREPIAACRPQQLGCIDFSIQPPRPVIAEQHDGRAVVIAVQ